MFQLPDSMPDLPPFYFNINIIKMLLSSVISVSQLVIGLNNQDKCTIQPWIPMWLIVAGVVGIVCTFLWIIYIVIAYIL